MFWAKLQEHVFSCIFIITQRKKYEYPCDSFYVNYCKTHTFHEYFVPSFLSFFFFFGSRSKILKLIEKIVNGTSRIRTCVFKID